MQPETGKGSLSSWPNAHSNHFIRYSNTNSNNIDSINQTKQYVSLLINNKDKINNIDDLKQQTLAFEDLVSHSPMT